MEIDPYLIIPKKDNGKLDGRYKLSWTEESLYTNNNDLESFNSGTSHIGTSFTSKRLFAFLLLAAVVIVAIIGRIFYLQILLGNNYVAMAESNSQRIVEIPSERGVIFDRNGLQLTQNIPNFSLAIVPQDLPRDKDEIDYIIERLSSITGQEKTEIAETLEKYKDYQRDFIIITEDIPYDTALKIEIASADLPGIHVQVGSKRLYKDIKTEDEQKDFVSEEELVQITDEQKYNTISHVLGYMGKLSPEELEIYYKQGYLPSDSIGKTGVEKEYETYLRGTYGEKRVEVDARGREQQVLAEVDPIPGKNLYLTIDKDMQDKLEELVKWQLERIPYTYELAVGGDKTRASVIAVDPRNGEILALVSYPGFDNNDFSGGIDAKTYQSYIENPDRPLFNRAVGGTFPSGSVVKPAMALAALQEGIITASTRFLSTGGLHVGDWFFPDWQVGGHGMTDVRKSLAESVNTFYYYIGGGYQDFVGLGVSKIEEYLRDFGFAEKTGIDLPGEASGFLPSKEWKKKVKDERWYVGDTYNLSIGQGDFLTTPLQIAMMTASIANGGTLYTPHVVEKIVDVQTGDEELVESHVKNNNFISQNNLETVRLGMYDCVDYGSCWLLRQLPFQSGAKTGTAQWSSQADTHAWFTSFAPYDNPQIVVTVLVEEGGEGGYGAEPIASEFLKWWSENKYKNE